MCGSAEAVNIEENYETTTSNKISHGKYDQMGWKHYENELCQGIKSQSFSNVFRVSLDGSDAWAYDWILHERLQQVRTMRNQDDGNIYGFGQES